MRVALLQINAAVGAMCILGAGIDAEDVGKDTNGCYRLHSRKARLFAVKPNSGIEETEKE
jgi:hypothetical protein